MRRNHRRRERHAIGLAVLVARSLGVPWKVLEERHGRGRKALWQDARAVSREKTKHLRDETAKALRTP